MSSSPFKTKQFQDLKAEWYVKLKKDGFADIEHDEDRLKKWTSSVFGLKPEWNEIKAEYYRAAGMFLYDHLFKDKYERLVWQLHAEGLSVPNVIKALKAKGHKAYRSKIQRIIWALEKQMGIACRK